MGGFGICCDGVPCEGVCTGGSNTILAMRLEIGGTHSHNILKLARNLNDNAVFPAECLKDSCDTPTVNVGADGPISVPSNLRPADCCVAFGWVTDTTEGASATVAGSRDWQFTITKAESGATLNLCDPTGPFLPWQKNSNYLLKGYVSLVARRVIDSVKLKFCPTVGPSSEPLWTVTAEVCWRVVYASRENGDDVRYVDAWRHLTNYNIFTSTCVDPVVKKFCARICYYDEGVGSPPLVIGSGFTNLEHDCIFRESTLCYNPIPIAIGTQCSDSTNYTCAFFALDKVRVIAVQQKRVITIDRTCALPSSLSFPYASLSGGNSDVSVSWSRSLALICDYQNGTRDETGDYSDFSVYAAMTEPWTITLTPAATAPFMADLGHLTHDFMGELI